MVAESRYRSARLEEVAQRAGVSIATASRALHGSRRVSPELQARVHEAAKALNYSASLPARAMVQGRTNIVGLIIHDISDPYFSGIAEGVVKAAEASGQLVMLASTGRKADREAEHLRAFRSQRARGVILLGSREGRDENLERLRDEILAFQADGGRVVAVSQRKLPVNTLVIENRRASSDLAKALIAQGHRRFAVLAGPPDLLVSRDRLEGMRRGIVKAGLTLDPRNVVHSDFSRDGGRRGAMKLIEQGLNVDCIAAVSDEMAVGALAVLRDGGIAVPGQVGVCGFGDIPGLRDFNPSLTTISLPLQLIGERAFETVQAENAPHPLVRRIHGTIVIRESTFATPPDGSAVKFE